MPFLKKRYLTVLLLFSFVVSADAQSVIDNDYLNVVKGRAYKIAAPLNIGDSAKFYRVRDKIARLYIDIKQIDDKKSNANAATKNGKVTAAEKAKIQELSEKKRDKLAVKFVRSLSKDLDMKQIDQVKDGLTYNVLPLTYKAHVEMIPLLKEEEKKYIYNALSEAREHAIVAGSSDAKHAWFGKYKGRINNYLTARGYNLTEERKAWEERIKAQKSSAPGNN